MRRMPLLVSMLLACGPPNPVRSVASAPPAPQRSAPPACSDEVTRQLFGTAPALVGRVDTRDSATIIPRSFANAMYDALANRRVRVQELTVSPTVRIEFGIDRDGRVENSVLPVYTGPEWFAAQVIGAVGSAVLTKSIPSVPPELRGRSLPLVLEIRPGPPVDGWRPFPLRIALDTSQVDAVAMAAAGNGPPRYPSNLLKQRVSGDVFLGFIVDSTGRADMSSVTPLRFTSPEFLDAVIQVLPSFRFHAATASGCTVPAWVEQPFSFRVFE